MQGLVHSRAAEMLGVTVKMEMEAVMVVMVVMVVTVVMPVKMMKLHFPRSHPVLFPHHFL